MIGFAATRTSKWPRGLYLLLCFTWVGAALADPSRAFAMSCTQPSPWFREQIALVAPPPSLPDGVEIRVVPGAPTTTQRNHALIRMDIAQSHLLITNQSNAPLYVLSERAAFTSSSASATIKEPVVGSVGVPAGWLPIQTASEGKASIWSYHGYDSDGPGSWLPLGSAITVTDGGFGLSADFENHIRQENDRPRDAAIPQAQAGSLSLLYEGQVIRVPFSVSYSMNGDYDPRRGRCPDVGGALCWGGVMFLGVLVLAVAVFVSLAVALTPKSWRSK